MKTILLCFKEYIALMRKLMLMQRLYYVDENYITQRYIVDFWEKKRAIAG